MPKEHSKSKYMLDTNTSSYIIKGTYPTIHKHLLSVPMSDICISAVTEGELLFGIARKPQAKSLQLAVQEFLLRVDILAWDSPASASYAKLRAYCEQQGTLLGNLDMMIAAHSIAIGATLVSSDQAFYKIKRYLNLVNWNSK